MDKELIDTLREKLSALTPRELRWLVAYAETKVRENIVEQQDALVRLRAGMLPPPKRHAGSGSVTLESETERVTENIVLYTKMLVFTQALEAVVMDVMGDDFAKEFAAFLRSRNARAK